MQKLLSILIFTTILLAPLYVVRWSWFGTLPTTLLETLILATVAVWGIAKILRKDFSWPRTAFDKPILLFLLAGVISLFVTPDLRGALGVFKAYIVEPLLFFYLLIDVAWNDQTSSLQPQKVLNFKFGALNLFGTWNLVLGASSLILCALTLSGFWISLLGIAQVIFKVGIVTPHEAAAGRAHAVYNTGNAVGLYLGPIFALTLGFFLRNFTSLRSKFSIFPSTTLEAGNFQFSIKNRKSQTIIVYCLLLIVMAAAILLSKSTGALVGLAAVLAVFLVFRVVGVVRGFGVMRVIGIIGMIVGMLFFLNISRFTPKVVNPWERPTTSTLAPRLCLWEGTKNLFLERPIFGVGLSGFKELYSEKYFTCDAEPLEYPHNWVLNFWSEMGILGLLGFLAILWVFFERVKRVERRKKVALTAAMVYSLVHGLVDVPYFKNDLALEFWVIIALSEILAQHQSLPYQNQQ